MSEGTPRGDGGKGRVVLNWALVYGAWAVLSAAAVGAVFLIRGCVLDAYTAFAWNKNTMALVDKWLLLGLGVAALIWILYLQHDLVQAYPGGTSLGRFPRRLRRAALITLATLVPPAMALLLL